MSENGAKTEYSVSELSRLIQNIVESSCRNVCLIAEVASVKVHSSGHTYFVLKDENAVIDAILWRGVAAARGIVLRDGMRVRCIGSVSTYPMRSKYQIVIHSLEEYGVGVLLQAIEERKRRLSAEGIFANHRELCKYPRVIGVITSPTGAVLQDMLHRFRQRYPLIQIILCPVLVQGSGASEQICDAIARMNRYSRDIRKVDVLVIARGGGSLEDLMSFNDENLARCVFHSAIPVVSAIGHETDTTIIDYAADLRAPTPTAAAELIVPDKQILLAQLEQYGHRMRHLCMQSFLSKRSYALKLTNLRMYLNHLYQRIDLVGEKLDRVLHNIRASFNVVRQIRLQRPELRAFTYKEHTMKIEFSRHQLMLQLRGKVDVLASQLESHSHHQVMKKGYAMVLDTDGATITKCSEVRNEMEVVFQDGSVRVSTQACLSLGS